MNYDNYEVARLIVSKRDIRIWTLTTIGILLCGAVVYAQSAGRSRNRQTPTTQKKPQSTPEFENYVKLGDEARLTGRLSEALEIYGKALRIRPEWPEGWWNVATILYELDRYMEARDAFRNLVALDPKNGRAWGMLGLCEFQTREYERAVVSLQRGRSLGLANNPEIESVVRYHTALLYIRFEHFEIAYDILSEFLLVGDQSSKVMEAFGLAMLRMPFLSKEIPPDKREAVTLAGRAGYYMAARRLEEARVAFSELLVRYPDAPNVHYANGVFLLNQDADAAIKEFRRELEISPSHQPTMVQLAFEYMKRDELETALPFAEKAVQLSPKMFPARNVLGRILLDLGQVERAIKELEEGARLAPESPEMHFALARAYTRVGRKADAARERELFKKLQDEFEARRVRRAGAQADENPSKPKP